MTRTSAQFYGTAGSGEKEGHPFRGNQWTDVYGGSMEIVAGGGTLTLGDLPGFHAEAKRFSDELFASQQAAGGSLMRGIELSVTPERFGNTKYSAFASSSERQESSAKIADFDRLIASGDVKRQDALDAVAVLMTQTERYKQLYPNMPPLYTIAFEESDQTAYSIRMGMGNAMGGGIVLGARTNFKGYITLDWTFISENGPKSAEMSMKAGWWTTPTIKSTLDHEMFHLLGRRWTQPFEGTTGQPSIVRVTAEEYLKHPDRYKGHPYLESSGAKIPSTFDSKREAKTVRKMARLAIAWSRIADAPEKTQKKKLSRYGCRTFNEGCAEAWAEYQNSKKPRPFAKRVGRTFEGIFREYYGPDAIRKGHPRTT